MQCLPTSLPSFPLSTTALGHTHPALTLSHRWRCGLQLSAKPRGTCHAVICSVIISVCVCVCMCLSNGPFNCINMHATCSSSAETSSNVKEAAASSSSSPIKCTNRSGRGMVAGIVKIFNLINAIEADPCCVACVFACNRNVANLNGPLCCLEALSLPLSPFLTVSLCLSQIWP